MSDITPPESDGPRKKLRKARPDAPDDKKHRTKRDRTKRREIASEEDCLHALSRLPGLVVMGVVTTAQSNSIRGVYATILNHQKAKNARADQTLDNDDLLDALRQNPTLINMLEPLLTDEQIKMLMEAATDGDDEQT